MREISKSDKFGTTLDKPLTKNDQTMGSRTEKKAKKSGLIFKIKQIIIYFRLKRKR